MEQILTDDKKQANANREPVRKGANGASHFKRKGEEPDPIEEMRKTADSLVSIAIKAFMQMRNVDYETAQRWIAGAAALEARNKMPAPSLEKPSH